MEKVNVTWEGMGGVSEFKYLGVLINVDRDIAEEVSHRLLKGNKICETL